VPRTGAGRGNRARVVGKLCHRVEIKNPGDGYSRVTYCRDVLQIPLNDRSNGEVGSARHGARRDLTAASFAAFCFGFVEAKADPSVPLLGQK
jgi:hypothetical protein